MKQITFVEEIVLKTLQCGTCSIPFALPETLWNTCYNEGGFFYCPAGHSRGWDKGNCKTALDKLREDLKAKENDLEYYRKRTDEIFEQKQAVERRLSFQKGVVTKMKNRAANGVCQCCNRSFQNLHRHMTTKHPEYLTDAK